jgi:hypothetical protein
MGNQFSGLFKLSLKPKTLIIVPHGFLHRLPIHGAISGSRFLIDYFPCVYFPAWNWLERITIKKFPVNGDTLILKKYEDYDFKKILNGRRFIENAGKANYLNINEHLKNLVIISHGEADPFDPFNSQLKLEPVLTVQDILSAEKPNLQGTRVFLGACESDLMPPIKEVVDEYISPATALLIKGAGAVIGTLWEVSPEKVEELFLKLLGTEYSELPKEIRDWQMKELNNWNEQKWRLYDHLPFRIYLNPQCLGKKIGGKDERNQEVISTSHFF